jgi:hypothetical protein
VVKNFKNLLQISQIIRIHLNKILLNPFNLWQKKQNDSMSLCGKKNFKNLPQISQIIGIHSNKILLNPFNPWPKKQTKALFY